MFGKGRGRPKNVVKVETSVPLVEPQSQEVKPQEVESQKDTKNTTAVAKAYRIIEGELLDSGLIRYSILSNVSLGEIGQEFEVED
jgi:hypothetical protein